MSVIAVELSRRERDVAAQYGLGYSVQRVAERLHISPRTVETHVRNIYGKLAIRSRDELIDFWRKQ